MQFGMLGAELGCGVIGPIGLVLGFGAGVALDANFLIKRRYDRS